MQTNFEQFALTSMLGHDDSPPRLAGKLCFGEEWQRTAFGVALALSKSGYFDWEDFRQQLIAVIGEWERSHDTKITDKMLFDTKLELEITPNLGVKLIARVPGIEEPFEFKADFAGW